MRLTRHLALVFALIAAAAPQLPGKDRKNKAAPADQDRITVTAHIAVTGGPVTRFLATGHYGRSYVYAERAVDQPITLLDVTNPAQPKIVSQFATGELPSGTGAESNLVVVSGTAAISTSAPAKGTEPGPQTIRLLDFSDPSHPRVTQQFEGVTAVQRISGTVTLLANADGIWILTNHLADDPESDERYARKVLYGDSMF